MSPALVSLLLLVSLPGRAPDSLLDRARFMFFNRHLNPTWLDSAYGMLASARKDYPSDERCLCLWSRIHIQQGDGARTRADRLRLFYRARAIAETLKALNDSNADGHTWWGVAQGRVGQTRGVLNSLFMVPDLKREFFRSVDLDPRCATAYDALGVLYYELPGFAGGSLTRSEEYLKKGLEIDPNYTLIRLDLAKVHSKQHRWPEARQQLAALLGTAEPTYPGDFELDDKPEALQLLTEIKDK